MLIVNADDLGRTTVATDATMSCFGQRRITSTSAMVFMQDSERAAELALGSGIEVGLHVNLSERFSGPAPGRLRDCQDAIRGFLTVNKYALVLYHPGLAAKFRYAFDAQHAEFLRLYGRQPSHFDGHQHMHLASNMLLQRILPPGTKVRRSFSFGPGDKSLANRWYRAVVDRWLSRRHCLTDYFFSLAHHLSRAGLERVVSLATEASVELMAHPHLPAEYEFLMSDAYAEAVSHVQLRGHDVLGERRRPHARKSIHG